MKWILVILCLVAIYAGYVRKYESRPVPVSAPESEPEALAPLEPNPPQVIPNPPEKGTVVEDFAGYKYLCYLPKGYGTMQEKWPLIIFLHGACADESLAKLKHFGPIKYGLDHSDFPFLAVSPATARGWSLYGFNQLWLGLHTRFPDIDWSRVYLTGYSMGAHATWMLAAAYPDRFAAIAPVAGAGNPGQVYILRQIPTWVFHGANDKVVPVGHGVTMVQALKQAGGEVKVTIYAHCGHESWQPAYRTDALYDWFLEHHK